MLSGAACRAGHLMLEFGHAAKVVTPRIPFDLRSHAPCRLNALVVFAQQLQICMPHPVWHGQRPIPLTLSTLAVGAMRLVEPWVCGAGLVDTARATDISDKNIAPHLGIFTHSIPLRWSAREFMGFLIGLDASLSR